MLVIRTHAFVAVLTVLLCSCSTIEPRPVADTGASLPSGFSTSGTIQHSLDDPEVAAMWSSAEIAREEKQYTEASVHIERALRIIPDDPVLWSRLAELRMHLDENVLAENYAAKSNALASENPVLQYRNWLIIQHARDKRGDVLGAREAQVEVRKFADE